MNADLIEHEPDAGKLNSVTRNNSFFQALNSMSTATNAHNTNHSAGGAALANAPNITNSTYASNGIYGTLPKGTNDKLLIDRSTALSASVYGNVSAVANEFEQLIARNAAAASTNASNANPAAPNYNTLGSYRVQYSSTNPFLPTFNPQQNNAIALNSMDHSRTNDEH